MSAYFRIILSRVKNISRTAFLYLPYGFCDGPSDSRIGASAIPFLINGWKIYLKLEAIIVSTTEAKDTEQVRVVSCNLVMHCSGLIRSSLPLVIQPSRMQVIGMTLSLLVSYVFHALKNQRDLYDFYRLLSVVNNITASS